MSTEAQSEEFQKYSFCVHHWLVEMPKGPTSRAVCTRCKMVREFINDPDAATYAERRAVASEEPKV